MYRLTCRRQRALTPLALTLAMAGLGSTGRSHAGCGLEDPSRAAPARLTPTMFLKTDYDEERAAIVGLWKFEMIAKSTATNKNPMPDGALVDFGISAWHSDGTELINSGGRNPADGDFCQGVWAQIGPSTFKLTHTPLGWGGGSYIGPAKLQMVVTVDESRSHFSGGFVLTQYSASPTQGHEFDESVPLVTITGTISAKRMTP
jgi:hypothetical protein